MPLFAAMSALAVAAVLVTPSTPATSTPVNASSAPESALPSGNTSYRTLADYEDGMAELAAEHPTLVKPITLPYPTSSGRTVRGIEITRDVQANDGKPVFVDVGMHHGNEWPSGELTM